MSTQLRNVIIGLGVTFTLAFLGVFAGGGGISVVPATIIGVGVWYYLSSVAGNRQVPTMSTAQRDAALASMPPAGGGFVYVYRDGLSGNFLGFDVVLDGQTVAQLKSPRFTQLAVLAGSHQLSVGPTGFGGTQNKAVPTTFAIEAGETVVFAARVNRGMAQNTVVLDREAEAATALRKFSTMEMVAGGGSPGVSRG